MENKNLVFDMSWPSGKKAEFIRNNESDIYVGVTADGLEAEVHLQKGEGCVVKYTAPTKPKWFQCIEYDSDGFRVGEWPEYKRGQEV